MSVSLSMLIAIVVFILIALILIYLKSKKINTIVVYQGLVALATIILFF